MLLFGFVNFGNIFIKLFFSKKKSKGGFLTLKFYVFFKFYFEVSKCNKYLWDGTLSCNIIYVTIWKCLNLRYLEEG